MRRIAFLFFLATLTLPRAAQAVPASCNATAAGIAPVVISVTPNSLGECRFIATGPTTFVAAAHTPFVISSTRDGGRHWRILYRWLGTGAITGSLRTVAGETVKGRILCWNPLESHVCAPHDWLMGTSWLGSLTVASQ